RRVAAAVATVAQRCAGHRTRAVGVRSAARARRPDATVWRALARGIRHRVDRRRTHWRGRCLLRYLRELQPAGLPQLARPIVERAGGTMPLDEMTRRNLE